MHLSSAFLSSGWGTPGILGGIATFYIKVTQFSEPSGMIWKQSLHPGEIRKAMRRWETMAATHWRLKMSPILGQEKGPKRTERPGYWGALFFNFSWFPPGSPGLPLPGKADDKCIRTHSWKDSSPEIKVYLSADLKRTDPAKHSVIYISIESSYLPKQESAIIFAGYRSVQKLCPLSWFIPPPPILAVWQSSGRSRNTKQRPKRNMY